LGWGGGGAGRLLMKHAQDGRCTLGETFVSFHHGPAAAYISISCSKTYRIGV